MWSRKTKTFWYCLCINGLIMSNWKCKGSTFIQVRIFYCVKQFITIEIQICIKFWCGIIACSGFNHRGCVKLGPVNHFIWPMFLFSFCTALQWYVEEKDPWAFKFCKHYFLYFNFCMSADLLNWNNFQLWQCSKLKKKLCMKYYKLFMNILFFNP